MDLVAAVAVPVQRYMFRDISVCAHRDVIYTGFYAKTVVQLVFFIHNDCHLADKPLRGMRMIFQGNCPLRGWKSARYNICRYYTIQEHGEKEWILHNEKDFSNYIDYFATVHTLPIKQRMRGPYPASHSREFFGNCDQ